MISQLVFGTNILPVSSISFGPEFSQMNLIKINIRNCLRKFLGENIFILFNELSIEWCLRIIIEGELTANSNYLEV